MNAISRFIRKIFGMPVTVPTLTDEEIIDRYVLTGLEFGEVVNYIYVSECVGFDKLLNMWEQSEREYAFLGFRTCSLDDFINAASWGASLKNLKVPRDIGEEPVYHAVHFKKMFVDGKLRANNYTVPTTKHMTRK